jgi:hypothetical protein
MGHSLLTQRRKDLACMSSHAGPTRSSSEHAPTSARVSNPLYVFQRDDLFATGFERTNPTQQLFALRSWSDRRALPRSANTVATLGI